MLDKICGRWILLFKNTKIQLFGINASHLNILMYKCVEPANLCRTFFFFFFFFGERTCAEPDSEDMNINYFGAYDKMILVPLL